MFSPLLASKIDAIVDKFGINADAFISHFIAFSILVFVMVRWGIKPIMAQLEERKKRILEGEEMRAQSKQELATVKESSVLIIEEARQQSQEKLEHAKQLASHVQEQAAAKAADDAGKTLENARKQAELEAQQQRDALRQDFARLVATATASVTGKVLSDADQRLINDEAIKQL